MTSKEMKELCRSLGADLVGIASVDRFADAPVGYHPRDVMPTAKSVIVLATILPADTLRQDIRTYTDIRNQAIGKMDKVAKDVAAALKKQSHKATAIVSLGGRWTDGMVASVRAYRSNTRQRLPGLG